MVISYRSFGTTCRSQKSAVPSYFAAWTWSHAEILMLLLVVCIITTGLWSFKLLVTCLLTIVFIVLYNILQILPVFSPYSSIDSHWHPCVGIILEIHLTLLINRNWLHWFSDRGNLFSCVCAGHQMTLGILSGFTAIYLSLRPVIVRRWTWQMITTRDILLNVSRTRQRRPEESVRLFQYSLRSSPVWRLKLVYRFLQRYDVMPVGK